MESTILDLFGFSSFSIEALCYILQLSVETLGPQLDVLINDFKLHRDGESRYRLFPNRTLISSQIQHDDELWNRSIEHFENYAKSIEPNLTGKEQNLYLDRLELEHDIYRWILSAITPSIGKINSVRRETQLFSIVGSLSRFWWMRGHSKEGWNWIQQALQACNQNRDDKEWKIAKARALKAAGAVTFALGSLNDSLKMYRESKSIWEQVEDEVNLAGILNLIGQVLREQGQYKDAKEAHEASLKIYEKRKEDWGIALCLNNLGVVAFFEESLEECEQWHKRALEIRRKINDTQGIASSLNNLGALYFFSREDNVQARKCHEEAMELRIQIKDWWGVASSKNSMGMIERRDHHFEESGKLHGESLALFMQVGDKIGQCEAMEGTAGLLAEQGSLLEEAAILLKSSHHIREELKAFIPKPKQADHKHIMKAVHSKWIASRSHPPATEIDFTVEPFRSAKCMDLSGSTSFCLQVLKLQSPKDA